MLLIAINLKEILDLFEMRRLHFNNWIFHHRVSAVESLQKVLARPFASLMIWFLTGVALALPISVALILKNVESLTAKNQYKPSLTVFLDVGIDSIRGRLIADEIEGFEQVENLVFLTAEAALFQFGKESGLADLASGLEVNPIPATLFVNLKTDLTYLDAADFSEKLLFIPGVSQAIVDTAWLVRLENILVLVYRIVFFLTALLCLSAVFVISNMVRMSIDNRREEISVIKLVGGSDSFVRRPFLYIGLWYGFGGGLVASLLILLAEFFINAPVKALLESYRSDYVFLGLGPMEMIDIAVLGAVLGVLGAWISFVRRIRVIQP